MEVAQGGRRITAKGLEYLRGLDGECEEKGLQVATANVIMEEHE